MKANKEQKNKRLVLKFLWSYVIILIIPLVVVSLIYTIVSDVIEDDARKFNASILEQTRDILDRRLDEIDSMVEQIVLDDKINALLPLGRFEEGSPEYYKVYDILTHLPNYKITNNFIENYFIFFKEADIAVSPTTTYVKTPVISDISADTASGKEGMWGKYYSKEILPVNSFIINGKKQSGILYLQSFSVNARSNPRGLIAVLINKNEVDKLLEDVSIGDKGIVAVFDEDDELITYIRGSECDLDIKEIGLASSDDKLASAMNIKNMVASVVVSPYNGWRYISIVPREFLMDRVDYIRNLIVGLALLALLTGLLAACFMAYRNSKPIRELVAAIKGMMDNPNSREENEYKFVQNTVTQLIKNNEYLQDEMENQQALLKMAFFNRLLDGNFHNKRELDVYLRHIGVRLEGPKYVVLILKMNLDEDLISREILEELGIIQVVMKDLLTKEFNHNIYFHDIDSYKIGALISYEEDDEDKCAQLTEKIISNVQHKIYSSYNLNVVCAGGICSDILDVGSSFKEAKRVLDYSLAGNELKVYWHDQVPDVNEGYYYPIDIEIRLINYMKTGDMQETEKMVRDIFVENFVKRQLSKEMAQQLIYAVKGTIIRESSQSGYIDCIKDIYEKMDAVYSPKDFFDLAVTACVQICQLNTGKKEESKRQFKDKVLEYMDQVYIREDLNLYTIANEFNVTESYMYQFFKEYIGMTFSTYLERMRIQHACELLAQSDIPVKELAGMVGYNNDHTFRRAFKKVIGVNPSDYRISTSMYAEDKGLVSNQ